ncbi:hypothetical protein PSECIP111951_01399 [Pseudoalteromonas holothuriae]|uniref:Spore coat protein U domain-containing protein n=1 Tax=Pseudoalteromonas holothuriae TaxID=2963714 RepID=A0A9W4QQK0_9GAMM|nr:MULTISPECIES: hypothetical protein [unclassified Pseudoalteromonas]CAH9049387.1 hypothetical protein PSECIP111854_00020 [Pseudoalteromonas sp. CIP111854]CAH9056131.1 hypothetical protein PSECIP111951_01399 [Pseudoalteromonas sp. CIP111951]
MNTLIKPLFATLMLTSGSAAATILSTSGNEAKFSFEGTIEPVCKTTSGSTNEVSLNLDATQKTQDIGTLNVWCNTGENATTEYRSANGGFLIANNSQKSKIAYTLDIGEDSGIDLQNGTYKHLSATAAGNGTTGDTKATILKVTPQSQGLDDAGTYSDTITVIVTPN